MKKPKLVMCVIEIKETDEMIIGELRKQIMQLKEEVKEQIIIPQTIANDDDDVPVVKEWVRW